MISLSSVLQINLTLGTCINNMYCNKNDITRVRIAIIKSFLLHSIANQWGKLHHCKVVNDPLHNSEPGL